MNINNCLICNFKGSTRGGSTSIGIHLKRIHNLTRKEYYDIYLKKPGDGICKCGCGKQTPFQENFYFCYQSYVNKKHQGNKTLLIIKYNKNEEFIKQLSINSTKTIKTTLEKYWLVPENHIKKSLISQNRVKNPNDKFGKNWRVWTPESREKQSLLAINMIQDKNSNFGKSLGKIFVYKNIRMRSSWEVEFAKLCDKYNIKWEYEPKWFKLASGKRYLPDFYLPDLDQWIEVKPKKFQNQDLHMLGYELGLNKFKVLDKSNFNKFFESRPL